jgi:hypothetical protein
MSSIELEFLLNLGDAATATTPDETMRTTLEEIVIIEVAEAFHFRFFILKMDKSELDLGIDIDVFELIHQLRLFLPVLFQLFRVSFTKFYLQLLLPDRFLDALQLFEVL